MTTHSLAGRSILIVEDEPLVAFDIAQDFEAAGAVVFTARTSSKALALAGEPGMISAAVVDHALGDSDSAALCELLTKRKIPFVTYSGYPALEGPFLNGVVLRKPARGEQIVAIVADLLYGAQTTN